jgi:glycosyltransferase involved in cell wall biosynthesis
MLIITERQREKLGLGERVTFAGMYENPAELMRAFDIGLIPSRSEAFGIAAVEYMRMRVPVVASPAGSLLVKQGKTGFLLDRLEAKCIAETVKRLGAEKNLRNELVRNARVFSNRFDGKEQLRQLEDIYTTLAGPKEAGGP